LSMARDERNRVWRLAAPETAVTALLVVAILRVSTPVLALATGSARLPQWDMAKYGVSGLRLARALQDTDLLAFLRHLNGLDVWPPVFPLLEVPVFLLAGPGYASARGLVATLFVMAIVGWLLRPRRSLLMAKQLHARVGFRARSMLTFIAFPVALWMVVPSHAINFVRFLVNRSTGAPVLSLESLLFYPRVFIGEFSPSPAVGIAVLLMAASSLRKLHGSDEAGRVVALALLFSTIVALAHPYKQPRFFFLTAVLLWVAGSREAVEILSKALKRVTKSGQRWIAATLAGAVLLSAATVATDLDRLRRGHRQHTVNSSTAEVLNAVTDEAAKVRRSVLLGTWNHLSPWLVEWSCLQRGPSMDPDQVPQAPAGRARRSNVVRWLATDPPDLLMVLSAQPDSAPRPGFRSETRWLEPVRKQLVRDPRFHLVSRKDNPDTHYRIECFESTRADGEPVPR